MALGLLHPKAAMANLNMWCCCVLLLLALILVEASQHRNSGETDDSMTVPRPEDRLKGTFASPSPSGGEAWLECAMSIATTLVFLMLSLKGLLHLQAQGRAKAHTETRPSLPASEGHPSSDSPTVSPTSSPPTSPKLRHCDARSEASEASPVLQSSASERSPTTGIPEGATHARLFVGIDPGNDFKVVRRIIGKGGRHMKEIVDDFPGSKIRVRGRGSGYKEGPDKAEADEPLMICVRGSNPEQFGKVLSRIEELLGWVYSDYRAYHRYMNLPPPQNFGHTVKFIAI